LTENKLFDHEKIPLYWVNRLSFLIRKELGKRFQSKGFDISPEEWAVLLLLWENKERTPSLIADVTFRDRTTVTRLIDNMVKKELVKRGTCPNDRRKSIVTASDYGNHLQGELIPLAQCLIKETLKGIDAEDIDVTLRTLKAMTSNVSSLEFKA